jgi:hypothetical protein
VVSVRAMCCMLVLGFSVSKCVYSSGAGPCLFSKFLLVMFMCVRYLIAIWEKDSISLLVLGLEICRSWRSLTIVVCIVPLIPSTIEMGGSTINHSWDKSAWRMAYLSSFWLVASAENLSLQ